jgi:hypothetical protein
MFTALSQIFIKPYKKNEIVTRKLGVVLEQQWFKR